MNRRCTASVVSPRSVNGRSSVLEAIPGASSSGSREVIDCIRAIGIGAGVTIIRRSISLANVPIADLVSKRAAAARSKGGATDVFSNILTDEHLLLRGGFCAARNRKKTLARKVLVRCGGARAISQEFNNAIERSWKKIPGYEIVTGNPYERAIHVRAYILIDRRYFLRT